MTKDKYYTEEDTIHYVDCLGLFFAETFVHRKRIKVLRILIQQLNT